MNSPYTTIYARLVKSAVDLLVDHRNWDAQRAINKAAEQSKMFHAYYLSMKPGERAELVLLVIAKRKARKEDWQAQG